MTSVINPKFRPLMQNVNNDFLSLMAIGDAFGMKYEFVEHAIPVAKEALFCGPHPKFSAYQVGHYTDDTQMSLANAELLLKKPAEKICRDDFVLAWNAVFKRDPRQGYSRHMFQLMTEDLAPEDFYSRLDGKGTTGGAAMRAAPFGLLADLDMLNKLTREQALVTHNTNAGLNSALAVSISTHYLHHGGDIRYVEQFLTRQIGKDWDSAKNGLSDDPGNGLKIVRQALNAVQTNDTLSDVLLSGVSQARVADTDTVCAIAAAVSSRRMDVRDDLPESLRQGCENGTFGQDYLKHVDRQLMAKFPSTKQYERYIA